MGIGAMGVIQGLQTRSFGSFFGSFLWLFVFTELGAREGQSGPTGSSRRSSPRKPLAWGRTPGFIIRPSVWPLGASASPEQWVPLVGFLFLRGFALSTSLTGSLPWSRPCGSLSARMP